MAEGSRALQGAIFAALNGNLTDDASPANTLSIYDHVPQDTAAMFVVIGDDTITNSDTKVEDGIDVDAEIHIYSIYRGVQQVKYVMGQIYPLLHRVVLTASGYQITPGRLTFETVFPEPDGYRGVMRFNFVVIQT